MNNEQFNQLLKETSDERLAYFSIVIETEIANRLAERAGWVDDQVFEYDVAF